MRSSASSRRRDAPPGERELELLAPAVVDLGSLLLTAQLVVQDTQAEILLGGVGSSVVLDT